MSDFDHEFDTDADHTATRPGQLSSNAHWIFGSIFAALTLVGFGFGVWAGAARPKPPETAEKPKDKDKDNAPTAGRPPGTTPPNAGANPGGNPQGNPNGTPNPNGNNGNNGGTPGDPKPMDPKPMGTEPKPKDNPKPKDLEPKPKDDPKPPAGKPGAGSALANLGVGLLTEPGTAVAALPVPAGKAVSFKAEVAPIFLKYCNTCHGASAGKPKGGLDLRTVAAIMKGGDNGDVLKVGDPKKSTLFTSTQPGANEQMPPDGKPQPTDKEKQVIADWIASGAKPRRATIRRRITSRSRARMELTRRGDAG